MRPNFDRVREVMWNQLKTSLPRLIRGEPLSGAEIFGETLAVGGTMSFYRRILVEKKILAGNTRPGGKTEGGDPAAIRAFIASPESVGAVLWPRESEEWEAHEYAERMAALKQKSSPAEKDVEGPLAYLREKFIATQNKLENAHAKAFGVIPTKSEFRNFPLLKLTPAKRQLPAEATPPPAEVVEEAAAEPDIVELARAPERPPESEVPDATVTVPVEEAPAEETTVEEALLTLAHGTAKNMIYLRDQLDGLVNRPIPEPLPPPPAPAPVEVKVVVVDAAHFEQRLAALEVQLNEVLSIIRRLL